MAEGVSQLSWNDIPVRLLNMSERMLIFTMMDERLIRETKYTHLPRDYRGLGQLMGFDAVVIHEAESKRNPTEELLYLWERNEENTIGKLLEIFEQLERYDVIDDLTSILEKRRPDIIRRFNSNESCKDLSLKDLSLKDSISGPSSLQLDIVSRKLWEAFPARELQPLVTPVKYVIIHHTGHCSNEGHAAIREIQDFFMKRCGSFDIGYNFIISPEGTIFEGTGWGIMCGHPFRYSRISLSVAFLGDFNVNKPSKIMLENLNNLIQFSVEQAYLDYDYGLYAYSDLEADSHSPGINVVDIISKWPRYQASGEIRDLNAFNKNILGSPKIQTPPEKSEDDISWDVMFYQIK